MVCKWLKKWYDGGTGDTYVECKKLGIKEIYTFGGIYALNQFAHDYCMKCIHCEHVEEEKNDK